MDVAKRMNRPRVWGEISAQRVDEKEQEVERCCSGGEVEDV